MRRVADEGLVAPAIPHRTRTYNLPVNSRTLCQLSYAGSAGRMRQTR